MSGQGEASLSQPLSASPKWMPQALQSPVVGDTGSWSPTEPWGPWPPRVPCGAAPQRAALTETGVVGEEVQEALTFLLPVPAGVAGAPGSDAGRGVVDVVGGDGAACRDRWTRVAAGRYLRKGQ